MWSVAEMPIVGLWLQWENSKEQALKIEALSKGFRDCTIELDLSERESRSQRTLLY
jgi:hypothetical protein